jgi:hypothetical protein
MNPDCPLGTLRGSTVIIPDPARINQSPSNQALGYRLALKISCRFALLLCQNAPTKIPRDAASGMLHRTPQYRLAE